MTVLTDTQVVTASGGLVELGYSQITSNVTITSNTAGSGTEIIAPLTVVCDGSPVLVEFWCGQTIIAAGSQISLSLYRDGAEVHRQWAVTYNGTTNPDYPLMCASFRTTPSAGSHTFGVKAYGPSSPQMMATGTNNAPIFLRVSKIVQATQWPAVTTGTIICTSSTRPASPFVGQQIYETDTLSFRVWNGTYWSQVWPQTFVTASDTTTQDGPASNNFVYATATITITPGVWLVQGMAHLLNLVTADDTSVGLYNATTSAEITNSRGPAGTTTTTSSASLMSRLVSVTVSANTNVRVLCTRNGGSTIRAYGASGSPAAALWAQKVG